MNCDTHCKYRVVWSLKMGANLFLPTIPLNGQEFYTLNVLKTHSLAYI